MVVETAKVVVDPVALSWVTEVKDSEVVVLALVEVELVVGVMGKVEADLVAVGWEMEVGDLEVVVLVMAEME